MRNGYDEPTKNRYNEPIQNWYNKPTNHRYNEPMLFILDSLETQSYSPFKKTILRILELQYLLFFDSTLIL